MKVWPWLVVVSVYGRVTLPSLISHKHLLTLHALTYSYTHPAHAYSYALFFTVFYKHMYVYKHKLTCRVIMDCFCLTLTVTLVLRFVPCITRPVRPPSPMILLQEMFWFVFTSSSFLLFFYLNLINKSPPLKDTPLFG